MGAPAALGAVHAGRARLRRMAVGAVVPARCPSQGGLARAQSNSLGGVPNFHADKDWATIECSRNETDNVILNIGINRQTKD